VGLHCWIRAFSSCALSLESLSMSKDSKMEETFLRSACSLLAMLSRHASGAKVERHAVLPDHTELLVTHVCKSTFKCELPRPEQSYFRLVDASSRSGACSQQVQESKICQESGSRALIPKLSLHRPAVSLREAIVQLVLQSSMWLCSQSSMQLCVTYRVKLKTYQVCPSNR